VTMSDVSFGGIDLRGEVSLKIHFEDEWKYHGFEMASKFDN